MIRDGSKDPAIDLDTKLFNLLDNIKNTRPLCCHNSTAYTIIKSSISPPNSRVRVFLEMIVVGIIVSELSMPCRRRLSLTPKPFAASSLTLDYTIVEMLPRKLTWVNLQGENYHREIS